MKSVLCTVLLASSVAIAAEYRCTAERKVDFAYEYTAEQLAKGKFSTLVEETKEGTFLSRCSFSYIEGHVTCDRYRVDRVEVDPKVKIKKLYVFQHQFNVQVFPDLAFVEDNGRGSISFGHCKTTAP